MLNDTSAFFAADRECQPSGSKPQLSLRAYPTTFLSDVFSALSRSIGIGTKALRQDSQDVRLVHDQQRVAVDIDLGSGIAGKQHPVTFADLH